MNIDPTWHELAAQKLARYEALFKLLDDIQGLDDILDISNRIATQWKYFASVSSWRLVIFKECDFLVIDGFRGEAHIAEEPTLSQWDAYHQSLQRPRAIRMTDTWGGPPLPEHLACRRLEEVRVFPFIRGADRWIALLSVTARHEPFSELDIKFIRLFGSHFADRISAILLRRQALEALTQKATRDALTGLYNRGTIIELLEERLALAKRTGQPLSMILADIDYFKIINDRYGHLIGDEVLREVSLRLQTQMRDSDNLGRYGGEEFLFVLFPCDDKKAVKVAERFRQTIAYAPVFSGGDSPQKIDVSLSLGTSSTSGQPDVSIDALLKQADDALYRAKAGGRNCVRAGGPDGR